MLIEGNGMDLTKPNSYATVIHIEKPNGFAITFPKNKKLFAMLAKLPGAKFGENSPFPYMIFIPRSQFIQMKSILGKSAKWRTKEELEKDRFFLTREEETLQDVLDRIDISIDTSFMKVNLFSFQKLAVAWAIEPKGKKRNVLGGILADEMGLGKTATGMATACYLKKQGKVKNCLIITPATLKTQWQQEIEKFTHEDSIIIRTTDKKDTFGSRKKLFDRVRKEKPFFTIINYELLHQREVIDKVEVKGKKTKSGKPKMKKVFGNYLDLTEILDIGYDMIIVDEAHQMKNPDTLVSQAIRKINAKVKLLMTATPIEKELKHLYQLFDYVNPDTLTDQKIKDFEERREIFNTLYLLRRRNPFSYPIFQIEEFGEKNTRYLARKINPFMLRRKTEDVSDELPAKRETKVTVEFTDYQLEMYQKISKEMKKTKERMKKIQDEEERQMIEDMLKGLGAMRTLICDSPAVLLESQSPIAKRIIGKRKNFPRVPKLEHFLELVKNICFEYNQKVVVFTRYSRVANFLADEVRKLFKEEAKERKTKPFNLFVYEGKTDQGCKLRDELDKTGKDKSKAVCFGCPFYDKCETRTKYQWHFQNDDDTRVIIATDAANFGVNLHKGKYLINYDLPDQFSKFLQRSGRIRRLGSEHNKIYIINLVTKGGVDEKKLETLQRQMKINEKVVENTELDKDAIKKLDQQLNDIINAV